MTRSILAVALLLLGGCEPITFPATSPSLAPGSPVVLPSPPPGTAATAVSAIDPVVGVVEELLPSVVTVINKLASGVPQGSGSGFVVEAGRGYIVTNSHVVENGAAFDVVFSDNRKVEATLVGADPLTDLAVLRVQGQNLRAAILANSDAVRVGATVVAIGSPLGEFQNTVTSGIVSAKGRRVAVTASVFLEDLIQTDAAINQGNSGGPLIQVATKQVIGVNTLVAGNAQGLGFAVSSNTVRQIVEELIRSGRVVRGFIGIQYMQLSARQAAQLGLPQGTTGIVISQVVPGSPAQQTGIRPNDIVTKLNDQAIDPEHPLQSLMIKFRPGDRVRLTLLRDGREMTIELTLGQPQG